MSAVSDATVRAALTSSITAIGDRGIQRFVPRTTAEAVGIGVAVGVAEVVVASM